LCELLERTRFRFSVPIGALLAMMVPRDFSRLKGVAMGMKAEEKLEIAIDDLKTYLHANHSLYMEVNGELYYLTDVNDRYWRVQDTSKLNEKGHYVDCSELVPTLSEFLDLPVGEAGKSVNQLFDEADFYASVKPE
jgi:hypothetical protein